MLRFDNVVLNDYYYYYWCVPVSLLLNHLRVFSPQLMSNVINVSLTSLDLCHPLFFY